MIMQKACDSYVREICSIFFFSIIGEFRQIFGRFFSLILESEGKPAAIDIW